VIAVPHTEPEDEDFEDIAAVPPTLFVGPVTDESRALAVPPSLVAEVLA
jgi:hypothetical protein